MLRRQKRRERDASNGQIELDFPSSCKFTFIDFRPIGIFEQSNYKKSKGKGRIETMI
jgi:hypothetical protein